MISLRMTRRCLLKKFVLMSALVMILGNIGLFFLGLHGFWWGLMVGIFSGCANDGVD